MTKAKAKLPVQQLVILSIARFAEPVALTSVYPYLPEMIESFHVPKNQVAQWVGFTSAIFSLCQCFTGIAWGRASDRFGRKPIILLGLFCTMSTSVLFGFSKSLPMAIFARALAGLGNGNVGILRTTVAEMVPQRELQPRAFSIMPLIWTIGSIFGPSFGGFFSDPAKNHPSIFGGNKFFIHFPYALPNLIAAVFFLVGLATAFLFLEETLDTQKGKYDVGLAMGRTLTGIFKKKPKPFREPDDEYSTPFLHPTRRSSVSGFDVEDEESVTFSTGTPRKRPIIAPPGWHEVFTPQSNLNLVVYTILSIHGSAADQLLPIFMHYPHQKHPIEGRHRFSLKFSGGFGIDSSKIGLLFTIYGICGMFIQFLVYPPLARRWGILNSLRFFGLFFPLVYFLIPFTALVEGVEREMVTVFGLMFLKSWAAIFVYPCSTILLTNSATSLRILGTLNGVATSVAAVGKAVGPTIGGGLFRVGVDVGYVILPWWVISAIGVIGLIPMIWLVEMDGFGGGEDTDSDSDDEDLAIKDPDDVMEGRNTPPPDTFAILSGDEEDSEDSDGAVFEESTPLSKVASRSSAGSRLQVHATHGRVASPVGMRDALGRRLSGNLGYSRSGFGAGGSSFE